MHICISWSWILFYSPIVNNPNRSTLFCNVLNDHFDIIIWWWKTEGEGWETHLEFYRRPGQLRTSIIIKCKPTICFWMPGECIRLGGRCIFQDIVHVGLIMRFHPSESIGIQTRWTQRKPFSTKSQWMKPEHGICTATSFDDSSHLRSPRQKNAGEAIDHKFVPEFPLACTRRYFYLTVMLLSYHPGVRYCRNLHQLTATITVGWIAGPENVE